MGHLDRFLEFARNEIGEIDGDSLFNGPDSVEDVDLILYAYAGYVIDCAKSLDAELKVDSSNIIDYTEHKSHFLQFHSDYEIGGRRYRIILDECQFNFGKMAEDTMDFHNSTVAQIRSVIKNYHHVLNHVNPKLEEKAYNPANNLPSGPSLDEYSEER
jgi:hypothetical protein